MQASGTKTTTLRAGAYSVTSNLSFSTADNGEAWIGYPGETAVVDGGGTGVFSLTNPNHFTLQGLTFQNMGANGAQHQLRGLFHHSVEHLQRLRSVLPQWQTSLPTRSSTATPSDGQSPGNPAGNNGNGYAAINLFGTSSNNRVTRNLIKNTQGGGISFGNGPTQSGCSNNVIDRNLLQNVDNNVFDYGAIYIYDASHTGVGNQITNNVVDGYGGPNGVANQVKGIYLDDETSNVLVSGNVVRNGGAWALMIHGGDHNTFTNNIWDLSFPGSLLGFYQGSPIHDYGMAANVFTKNLIYSSSAYPSSLYLIYLYQGDALVASSNNLYYSAAGAGMPNTGMLESNPVLANPLFTSPSTADYSMPQSSPAFTLVGFAPLATGQQQVSGAPPGGGKLTGAVSSATTTASLTTEGAADWIHWGNASPIRKNGVTQQIGNYVIVGTGPANSYFDDARTLSWTDGAVTTSGSDAAGLYINAPHNGYSFTVPAGTSTRTLTVHAGGWVSSATLTAHLSDGSAADFVDITSQSTALFDRNYTLAFNAASDGQTLTVSWVQNSGMSGSNVNISGAALQ